MSNARTINIVTLPAKDQAVITAAKIGLIGAIIAAVIVAFASLLGTAITVMAGWQQKIACCWIPRDDWRQIARDNGWIPKGECRWETTRVTGLDMSNKKVKVQIHLLSGEYRWVYTSSTEAELGKEKADLNSIIKALEVDPKSKYIVAVGMASVEGDFVGQSALSKERTDKLISIIKGELKPVIPVHGLSLGRYIDEKTRTNPRETSEQRRVVIIEVLEREDNAVLEEAVYDALIKAITADPPIPFDVRNYKDRDYTDHDFGKK